VKSLENINAIAERFCGSDSLPRGAYPGLSKWVLNNLGFYDFKNT